MNTSYPLWSITILTILLYSMSLGLSRIGMVSKLNHRRFWNVLLLLTFLITGLIGLFMVVKINYKLHYPFYDKLVGYHVGFGIGMAVIGFFHFWWHLSYYLKLIRQGIRSGNHRERQLNPVEDNKKRTASHSLPMSSFLKIAAFLLGSTTIIAQVILIREFLTVFSGNELVIGVVLANWMVLTGIGAYSRKLPVRSKKSFSFITGGLLLLSVLPFATAFLINFLKNIVFPVGSLINVFQVFWSSLALLAPFCLASGFLFTFISAAFSERRNQNETGLVYGFESLGSVVGGLLSGLLFIFVFSSIESLLVLAIINGTLLFLSGLKYASGKWNWAPIMVIVTAFGLLFSNPEKRIRSFVYPNQKIEVSKDSPHGNIVVTRREKMWSVYTNNNLLFDSENFMLNEEAVHFAMLQHSNPEKVLLVSGGITGQLAELRKYEPMSIDYVEGNRWLLTLMKDTLDKINDESLHVFTTDPLRFIRNSPQTYDVVILNLPGPTTMQANRFYTREFFTLLKQKLTPGAVISFGIQSPPNYLNQEAVDLNSSLFVTLKTAFKHVIIIPGEKNYFMASDAPLTYNIAEAVQSRGIENRYVNQYYFDDSLLKNRSENILSALNQAAEINQNMRPVTYQQGLSYWLSQFKGKYWVLAVIAIAGSLLVFFRGNTSSKTMFLTGFSASGLEILLLFGLQVFFGNIYLLTSFVFAGFMLGLAAGSFLGKSFSRPSGKNYLAITQLLIGAFAGVTSVSLFSSGMEKLPAELIYTLFFAATLLIGGLTGFQFSKASIYNTGSYAEISGKTYSYDLVGSAAGALAVSIYLVPELGIIGSVWILAGINLIFGAWLFLKTKAGI